MKQIYTITLEISSFCNADCEFCIRKDIKINKNMNFDDSIIKFINSLKVNKNVKLSGNMGDALCNPDFYKFANTLCKTNQVQIVTHGSYKIEEFLKLDKSVRLRFSIDSIQEKDTYRKINAALALNNALSLHKIGYDVDIKSLLFEYNVNDLLKIREICKKENIEHFILSSRKYDNQGPLSNPSNYKNILNEYETRDNLRSNYIRCPVTSIYDLQINSEGYVTPCCMVPYEFQNKYHYTDIKKEEEISEIFKKYFFNVDTACLSCKFRNFNNKII